MRAEDVPPPHQLAHFDQAYARSGEHLDTLIEVHRGVLAEAAASREVDVTGLCAWIAANVEPEAMAEILTVAVDRLTTQAAERAEIERQVRAQAAAEIRSIFVPARRDMSPAEAKAEAYETAARHITRGEG